MNMEAVDWDELATQIAKRIRTKRTYSFDDACDFLHISSSSLSDLIAIGEIPAAKISRSWVLRDEDLDRYLSDQVRIQTEERREAYRNGSAVKIKPAVAAVRIRRRELPKLPNFPRSA